MKKVILIFAVAAVLAGCKNNEPEIGELNINNEVVPGQTISIPVSASKGMQSNNSPERKIYGDFTALTGVSFFWESGDTKIYVTSLDADGKPAKDPQYTSEFTLSPFSSETEPRIFTGKVPSIPAGGKTDMFLVWCGPETVPSEQTYNYEYTGINSNLMRFEAYSSLDVDKIELCPVWSFVQFQSKYVFNMRKDSLSQSYARKNLELNLEISQVTLKEYIYSPGDTEGDPIDSVQIVYSQEDKTNFYSTTQAFNNPVQPSYNFVVKPAKTYSLVLEIDYVSADGIGYNGSKSSRTEEVTYAPKRQVNEYTATGTITHHETISGIHTMRTTIINTAPLDTAVSQNMTMAEEMITWIPAEAW